MKAAFNIQLQGYPPANRDAKVELVNQATGQGVERKPFLDGSLLVRDIDPGTGRSRSRTRTSCQPIDRGAIRLFPQITPTFVPIPIVPRPVPGHADPRHPRRRPRRRSSRRRRPFATQLQPLGDKAGGRGDPRVGLERARRGASPTWPARCSS